MGLIVRNTCDREGGRSSTSAISFPDAMHLPSAAGTECRGRFNNLFVPEQVRRQCIDVAPGLALLRSRCARFRFGVFALQIQGHQPSAYHRRARSERRISASSTSRLWIEDPCSRPRKQGPFPSTRQAAREIFNAKRHAINLRPIPPIHRQIKLFSTQSSDASSPSEPSGTTPKAP